MRPTRASRTIAVVTFLLVVGAPCATRLNAQTAVQRTDLTLEVKALLARVDAGWLAGDHGVHAAALKRARDFVDKPFKTEAPTYDTLVAARDYLKMGKMARGREIASVASPDEKLKLLDDVMKGSSASLVGLPSETALIVGITDFFVTRAKDELAVAYLQTLQARLDQTPVIDSMLPALATSVRHANDMSPRSLIPLMKAAATRDFVGLPERATSIDAYPTGYLSIRSVDTTLLQGAHLALGLQREVREGAPPAVVMSRLAGLEARELKDDRIRSTLVILGVVSNEFTATGGAVAEIRKNPERMPYTVAFLAYDIGAAKGFAPPWAASRNKSGVLDSLLKFAEERQQQIVSLVARLEDAQQQVTQLRDAMQATDSTRWSARLAGARIVTELVRSALPLMPAAPAEMEGRSTVLRSALGVATELQEALSKRDYATVFAIVSPFVAPTVSEAMAMPGVGQQSDSVRQAYLKGVALSRERRNAYRIMALASSLATAGDADGVTHAIEAAADPVGSYRAKRVIAADESHLSYTLNGYVGVGGGGEWSVGRAERGRPAGQFGASVPFGVEMSLGGLGNPVPSWGLFVPLIDVGNVANFRLKADSLADTPKIGFSQVFAPGVFLMAGISESKPFSVGIGAQYAPSLRKSLGSDATSSVVRTSIIFGLDIPVLRF